MWSSVIGCPFFKHSIFKLRPHWSTGQYPSSFHDQTTFHWIDKAHLANPSFHWWTLGCFYILAVMNHAARNIHRQVFGGTYVFISLGYRHLRVKWLGHKTLWFSFWGTPYVFLNSCTLPHSHPVSQCPHQHLDHRHPHGREVTPLCGLHLHFSWYVKHHLIL